MQDGFPGAMPSQELTSGFSIMTLFYFYWSALPYSSRLSDPKMGSPGAGGRVTPTDPRFNCAILRNSRSVIATLPHVVCGTRAEMLKGTITFPLHLCWRPPSGVCSVGRLGPGPEISKISKCCPHASDTGHAMREGACKTASRSLVEDISDPQQYPEVPKPVHKHR